MEVLDENGNVSTSLRISMKDMVVIPVDSFKERDYNFTIRASISDGDYTITTNKTLKVENQANFLAQ